MRILGRTEHIRDVSPLSRDLRDEGAGLATTEKKKLHESLSVNERCAGRSARATHSGECLGIRIGKKCFMQPLDHRWHLLLVNHEREIYFRSSLRNHANLHV